MVFRQRLDKKIQHLSTDCPIEQPMYWQTLILNTFWTYFTLDRLWTRLSLDATLVGLLSPTHRYQTISGQILDETSSGQNPDLMLILYVSYVQRSGWAIKSGFCPEFVYVLNLSRLCPWTVRGQQEPMQNVLKSRNCQVCLVQLMFKLCPGYMSRK